jgi:hypothetical protein
MLDRLYKLLDDGFRAAPDTEEVAELKNEIRMDIEDRYNDLVAEGKTPEEAYELTASGMGDFSELVAELRKEELGNTSGYGSLEFAEGGGAVNAADVNSIDVHWTFGSVEIARAPGADIAFSEEFNTSARRDRRPYEMAWRLAGGRLTIEYQRPERRFLFGWRFGDGFRGGWDKRLTLSLPEGINLDSLKISSVSADISNKFSDWRAARVDIGTVNGTLEMGALRGDSVKLSTVNGRFDVNNVSCDDLRVSGVNGVLNIINPDCKSLRANTVNGKITVSLPEKMSGFSAKYSMVNGSFDCDFPVTLAKRQVTYGDGSSMLMKLDTVNGGIAITKA